MPNEFRAKNGVIAPKLQINNAESYLGDVSGIESWIHSQNFSVSAQESEPRDISFSSDGTRMYILGNAGNDITQYTLSTAWNISTAASPVVFSVAAQDTTPYGMFFHPDGTSFYMVGPTADVVYRYNMSTAWNVTTATFSNSFSVAAQETEPNAIYFSSDGTRMYIAGTTGDDVNQYNLGTAWDITTAVYNTVFSVSTYETAPQGLSFNNAGTKMYIVGSTYNRITEFNLGTAWSISTAVFSSYVNIRNLSTFDVSGVSGLYISEAQNKAWIVDYNNDRVFELTTNSTSLKVYGTKLVVQPDTHFYSDAIVHGNITGNTNLNIIGTATIGSVNSSNYLTGQGTAGITLGGTGGTGTITLGRSTATQILELGSGAVSSGNTKTINIGTGGLSGSTSTINIGSTLGTTTTINGNLNVPSGIKQGSQTYPSYSGNIEFGADVANTWRTLITVSSPTGTYVTIGFKIDVVDPNTNHATTTSVNPDIETYYVACVRTEVEVQDTPDSCYVRGPSNRIRAVKTSTGNYEVQIQNEGQYREYFVKIDVYASNANHTVTYSAGTTAAAGTAQYNCSVGTSINWFENVRASTAVRAPSIIASGASGTAELAADSGGNLSLGRRDNVASTPYIDFNTGSTTVDFDTRITASGGTGTAGNGTLTITAGSVVVSQNSSSDLFRITQTGTGNALVVEDTTNPDTSSFIIDSGGRVAIGGSTVSTASLNIPREASSNTSYTINLNPLLTPTAGVDAYGIRSVIDTSNTGAIGNVYDFAAIGGSNGGINATTHYGFFAGQTLANIGGTTYGFYSNLNVSGTNRWAFYANGTAPSYFGGDVRFDKTITAAGTTGAQTINKNCGSVNFAAAATSLVVTNNLVTANSIIVATVATNDSTMKSVAAVAGSGSFTLHANAAATAETRVNFLIIN